MPITSFKAISVLCALAAALVALPVRAQENGPAFVSDYTVFVDLPTAFAFIKLPMGWKFVGKLDADQLRHLPADTVTSLLPAADMAEQVASETLRQPGRKPKG